MSREEIKNKTYTIKWQLACPLHFITKEMLNYLNDKVKIAVKVPLERDGFERAKPLVSKI